MATYHPEDQAKLDRARELIPPAYHGHIIMMEPRFSKVLGRKVSNPYMTVAGRVAMAVDEHRAQGAALSIRTAFVNVGEHVVCRTTVVSALRGEATGMSRVNFGGTGVDASNPIENSESSSVGRALGFLGYGLLGGIASADEIANGVSGAQPETGPGGEGQHPQAGDDQPASDKQLEFITSLREKVGMTSVGLREYALSQGMVMLDHGDKQAVLPTRETASKLIDHLQRQLQGGTQAPDGVLPENDRKRLFATANKAGVSKNQIHAYLRERAWGMNDAFEVSVTRLTPEQCRTVEKQIGVHPVLKTPPATPTKGSTEVAGADHVGEPLTGPAVPAGVNAETGEITEPEGAPY
ncbi:MAG: hypothetical protein ACR2P5_02305 [Gammaproteobacteria bacterium]